MREHLKDRLRGEYSYTRGSLPGAWEHYIDVTAIGAVWDLLESLDLVQLTAHPDDCPFDDLHGDMFDETHASTIPGGMRELKAQLKRAHDRLEIDGQWFWEASVRTPDGYDDEYSEWHTADSIGGFVGDDFSESGYEPDLQVACLDAIADQYHVPHWRDCTPDVRQRAQVFVAGLIMGGLDIGDYTLEDFSWS